MITAFQVPARRVNGDGTALVMLSDALLSVRRRLFGRHALFERLTGPEQLWWRSCHAAVSAGHWPHGQQADQTLALIRGEDLARSDGTVADAAAAALYLSRALTVPDDEAARDLLNMAVDAWQSARPAVAIARAQSALAVSHALAKAGPDRRLRAATLLAGLDRAGQDTGQAMAAISVLLLTGTEPRVGTVRVPVALTGTRADDVIGVAGRLEMRLLPGGPAGLYPDPGQLLAIPPSDRDLAPVLDLAWQFATRGRPGKRCVLWRLTLDPRLRAWTIDGGTLGAAFAIALHQALRQGPASVPRVLTRPAGFFFRLRPQCAVTGELVGEPPEESAPADRFAARPAPLAHVAGLVAKSRAARVNGWRLVAPLANRELDRTRVPEALRISWAATAGAADRRARQVRVGRIIVVASVVLALAGFVHQGTAAITAAGVVQQRPQVPVSTSLPPTAGLLTGPQLQSLLVPVSDFPADYEVENETPSNSGPSFLYVPYALGCQDFSALQDLGNYDLGSAAAASAYLRNNGRTAEVNQGIFELWNQDQAASFFNQAHDLYMTCFRDIQSVKYSLQSAHIDGLSAFTETETTDTGIDTTVFAIKGFDVYHVGIYSSHGQALPTQPSLSSLIKHLVADVDEAGHKGTFTGPSPTGTGLSAAAAPGPAATVEAYINDINQHEYSLAWNLGGKNLTSYQNFVASLSDVQSEELHILSAQGSEVTAEVTTLQSTGTSSIAETIFTVSDGIIIKFYFP